MDLKAAELLARQEMARWLTQDEINGNFKWDLNISYVLKTRFGQVKLREMKLELSALLIATNSEKEVLDTIRHEIAHCLREVERGNYGGGVYSLTAGQFHDERWKQIARHVGCSATQFYDSPEAKAMGVAVNKPQGMRLMFPWIATCPNCGQRGGVRTRSKRVICGKCKTAGLGEFHFNYEPVIKFKG